MSRRARTDVVIVGGGVVGATCALALADAGLSVAVVEGHEPASWQAAIAFETRTSTTASRNDAATSAMGTGTPSASRFSTHRATAVLSPENEKS